MADAATHRWTASDGVELAWHELGEGRPAILLHGLFSSAEMNWIASQYSSPRLLLSNCRIAS